MRIARIRALYRRCIPVLARHSKFVRHWYRLPGNDYFRFERTQRIMEKVRQEVFGDAPLADRSARADALELLKRSYAQHCCQFELQRDWRVRFLQNLLAAVLLPIQVPLWLAKYRRQPAGSGPPAVKAVAFQYQPHTRALVESFFGAGEMKLLQARSAELSFQDLLFAVRLFRQWPRCWREPLFILKTLFGIGYYGYAIRRFRPSCMVDFQEHFSPASVQTAYCRRLGVRHVNMMHGHRFPVAELAFVCFDEFWVWGEYYRDLFSSLACPRDQFRIAGNPLHRLLTKASPAQGQRNGTPDLLVFYETLMTPQSQYLDLLVGLCAQLPPGWRVVLRCRAMRAHEESDGTDFARALQQQLAARGLPPARLESENDCGLPDALARAVAVAGIYTTALLDAWVAGCKIIQLQAPGEAFYVPAMPFAPSANVLAYNGNGAVAEFLMRPWSEGAREAALLQQVSRIDAASEAVAAAGNGDKVACREVAP